MNDTMRHLAVLLVAARDLVSAAGARHDVSGAIIPDTEFDALVEILDDIETTERMDREEGMAEERIGRA